MCVWVHGGWINQGVSVIVGLAYDGCGICTCACLCVCVCRCVCVCMLVGGCIGVHVICVANYL